MTPYTKLKMHLERHMYKRGQYKGEAPADSSRRSKNHFRVVRGNGGQMCVRMYNTDLITVTPDNRITIDMGGWWGPTTKANLNEAMWRFLGWGGVGTVVLGGYRQLAFRANGKTYRYYDGMEFDMEGTLLSFAKRFTKQRTDRDATAEFRNDMKESGFKDVWPVLFASTEPSRIWGMAPKYMLKIVTQECHANKWPEVAAFYKCYHSDHKEAYQALTKACTSHMKELYDTDITAL